MGFDAAHAISALSKLALRAYRKKEENQKHAEAQEAIESVLRKYKDRAGFLSLLESRGRDIFMHMIVSEDEDATLKALYLAEDVNKEDRDGNTYLTFACLYHKLKIIEKLLDMGADPNHSSCPLLKALGRKNEANPAILALFLRHGVDLKTDVHGRTLEETIRSFGDAALDEILDKR